jgi:hypothetical protein
MKIKPQKFLVESFQEQASWIGNLFGPLNQVLNDLWISYNNNLTIGDNLYQEIKEIKFINSTTNFPLKFKTKFNVFPQGLNLVYLYDNTTGAMAIPSTAPYIVWTFLNNDVIISSISGLTSNRTYTMRIHCIYG